jgi:holo-[acyl-carrier protein] synthase
MKNTLNLHLISALHILGEGEKSSNPGSKSTPFAIGTDVAWIPEVAASIARFGDAYLTRIYTAQELRTCRDVYGRPQAARLAARFAAKEAVIKVLSPSPNEAIPLRTVEVVTGPKGEPTVRLSGAAQDLAEKQGIHHIALSLSHDQDYAAAVAAARPGVQ